MAANFKGSPPCAKGRSPAIDGWQVALDIGDPLQVQLHPGVVDLLAVHHFDFKKFVAVDDDFLQRVADLLESQKGQRHCALKLAILKNRI